MNEKYISYLAHESITARLERQSKRYFILCIILIVALIATNFAWICWEAQFEDVVTTVTQEAESDEGDAVINGDKAGAVIYGED